MKNTTFNKAQFIEVLKTLTPFEIEAVKQAYESSKGNGHDFGYADDINVAGVKASGNGGVISSLIKKGVIVWDNEYGQIAFFSFYDEKYEAADAVKEFFTL